MSVLDSIIEGVREDLASRRLPMSELLEAIEVAPPVRDCLSALLTEDISVIAEVKRSCLLYTSPSPRDRQKSRMPSSA